MTSIADVTIAPADAEQAERLQQVLDLAPHWDQAEAIRYIRTGHGREKLEAQVTTEQLQQNARGMMVDRITKQLGYDNTALLPGHLVIIGRLAEVAKRRVGARPLLGLDNREIDAAIELVNQLPETPEIRDWLAWTKNRNAEL